LIDHGLYDEGYLVMIAPALNYKCKPAVNEPRAYGS
jgi:hypothetical protein